MNKRNYLYILLFVISLLVYSVLIVDAHQRCRHMDVNHDGHVLASDALFVLRAAVGLHPCLP